MGVDYEAYAIIGIPVRVSHFKEFKVVKAFEHNYPETMKYCPNTGKALWVTHEHYTDAIDEDGVGDCKLNGIPLLRTDYYDEEDNFFVVALQVSTDCGDEMAEFDPKEIKAKKKEIKEVLEPLGLWDESKFGLWAVMGAH